MPTIKVMAHQTTAELAQYLNEQRPRPPRNFVPELVSGSQVKPSIPWPDLEMPPSNGWWADRQNCECPPCYYYSITEQINGGKLPFTVSVPLARLINVGLIRLNFKHEDHRNEFSTEDRVYALSAYRDICWGIHSGQMPLQLLEILLMASRKAVLKPLSSDDPEYDRKELEVYLKRAIEKLKDAEHDESESEQTESEQTAEGAQDASRQTVGDSSDEDADEESGDGDSNGSSDEHHSADSESVSSVPTQPSRKLTAIRSEAPGVVTAIRTSHN